MEDDTTKRAGASGLQKLLKKSLENLMRAGRFDAIERSGVFNSYANEDINRIQHYATAYQEQFRLPRTLEAMQLVAQLPVTKFESALRAIYRTSSISEAIEAMHSPGVNRLDELRSLRGFVAL